MSQQGDAACPLCTGPARYRTLVGEARWEFSCANCSTYHITEQARRYLVKEATWDVALSAKAASPGEGHTLVVLVEQGKLTARAVLTVTLPK